MPRPSPSSCPPRWVPHDGTVSTTEHPADTCPPPGPQPPSPLPAQETGQGGPAPRSRRRRGPVIAVVLIAVALLVVASVTIPVNVVIEAPGPTWNVLAAGGEGSADVLTVSGAPTYQADGALRMTTVSVSGCPGYPVHLVDLVGAWLDDEEEILDRESVCPSNLSQEQVDQANQAQMTGSQDAAVVAALMETGLATTMTLTISGVAQEQADSGLKAGDVLVSVTPSGAATTTITTYTDLRTLMSSLAPGTEVTLGLRRDGAETTATVTTLAPPQGSDRQGSLLGVYLSARADSGVEVSFGLADVGGPSAGMMFALGIVDEVTPGSLTGGQDVAGTGTIAIDGTVGPIGGIAQKMAGARRAGSRYFLAPAANCPEVVGHVPAGLEVVSVSTLHEAVTALKSIASGSTSDLPTCESR